MSVVYLILQPSISRTKEPPNLKPLYEHGEVTAVLPAGRAPVFTPGECMEIIENKLADFHPETDYLAWAGGDALAALMAGMALANMDIWQFKWLRYERHRLPDGTRVHEGATYVPVDIDLRDPQFSLLGEPADEEEAPTSVE